MDNSYSSGTNDLERYLVYSRREILQLLRGVKDSRQLVRMIFNKGSETIVTSILDVDDASNYVYVDCGPDQSQNQRIGDSPRVVFETMLDKIRIQFSTQEIGTFPFEGKPAFYFQIPETLMRLQRREYYRIRTPRCQVLVPIEEENGSKQELTLYMSDISAGGIGLSDEAMVLNETPGTLYRDCKMTLSDKSVIIATLQVRNSQEITLANGKITRRLGCQFIDLSGRNLMNVQRYITTLEREQNALSLG